MPTLCQFENCRKRASYATTYGKPERCNEHREGRKLQYAICRCGNARPTYNLLDESRPVCCRLCKSDIMVNVVNKRCCGNSRPIYNELGEKNALYCSNCKSDTMVNVVNKRCYCGKSNPIFNAPNEKVALYCSNCKSDTMVDVKNKRCCCGKSLPNFNESGAKVALYCSNCKSDTMVNVKNKRCYCGKSRPTFNDPNEKNALYCSNCKSDTMVNVVSKRCYCGKSLPLFNDPPEKNALYCSNCKSDTMVDVINKRCKGQDGTCTIAANKKYKGYCTFCFANMFPTDPLTYQSRSKTKEIATRDFINDHFEGFGHDKPIYTDHCDCSVRRRIDHRKLIGNTMLAIETDENQHKSYDAMDEQIRYDDLFNAFSGKWIYIRFNPDKFRNKAGVSKNPTIAMRLFELKAEMEHQIQRIESEENTELLEIKYMYYDGYT